MGLKEAIHGIYYFLVRLEYNIKTMTNAEFEALLNDREITYEQKAICNLFQIQTGEIVTQLLMQKVEK